MRMLAFIVGALVLSGAPARVAGQERGAALDQKVQAFLESRRGTWRDLNVPESDGRLLHDLIVKHKFTRALEIGTSTGHSGIWIAWALAKTGGTLTTLEIDPEQHSPGRAVVRGLGSALVTAMERAQAAGGDPTAVQRVACECIVLAETKDHLNWELLTKCAERLRGSQKRALEEACEFVEAQEDEHLYHSRGYCRELWLDALGLPAVLPPPEDEGMDARGRATQGAVAEMQHVRSAVSAAQAQQQSERNR